MAEIENVNVTVLADGEKMERLEKENAELLSWLKGALNIISETPELSPETAPFVGGAWDFINGGYSKAELECKGCMGPCGNCEEPKALEAEAKRLKDKMDNLFLFAKETHDRSELIRSKVCASDPRRAGCQVQLSHLCNELIRRIQE